MADRASLVSLLQALSRTSPTASVADFALAERPQDYAVPLDVRPATMRAPTVLERMRGAVEQGVAAVADQPLLRVLDLLAAGGGLRAIADAQSPPLVMMGEAQKKRVPNPIKAYHGSPHDFDQFSMEKIGTGEGAQAYGHGLYFAEAEPVARGYRNVLQDKNFVDAEKMARAAADAVGGSLSDGSVLFKGRMWKPDEWVDAFRTGKLSGHDFGPQARTQMEQALKGRMYEVNIHADPESFLDWDKPLSQQSEAVRKALNADYFGLTQNVRESVNGPSYFSEPLRERVDGKVRTGERIYRDLRNTAGTDTELTERLKGAGIPGIKYLDQGSRAAGEGSRNYVVFDDSLIEILRKYGLLPFAAGLGASRNEGR